jgi:hypothetical protein
LFQVKLIWLEDTAVAARFEGAAGADVLPPDVLPAWALAAVRKMPNPTAENLRQDRLLAARNNDLAPMESLMYAGHDSGLMNFILLELCRVFVRPGTPNRGTFLVFSVLFVRFCFLGAF